MSELERQFGLRRIVSGGQTGVDRAALDAAIELGLEHGGWCPRGRRAEDGPISRRYDLRETISAKYPPRTKRNVIDSDGTLLIYRGQLIGGTALTFQLARQLDKPYLLLDFESSQASSSVLAWIHAARIGTLNVAGPRESTAPGIAQQTLDFLVRCLSQVTVPK